MACPTICHKGAKGPAYFCRKRSRRLWCLRTERKLQIWHHARIGSDIMKALESSTKDKIYALREAIGITIKGKQETIQLAIVALLAEGHLLIEDVPGVGKTTLGHALARSLDCDFHRIQFTSDLLPSDVLGVSVYSPKLNEFEFKPGPIFANVVLADEINRTTPKTQSALLEAMNESQVTIENRTYP